MEGTVCGWPEDAAFNLLVEGDLHARVTNVGHAAVIGSVFTDYQFLWAESNFSCGGVMHARAVFVEEDDNYPDDKLAPGTLQLGGFKGLDRNDYILEEFRIEDPQWALWEAAERGREILVDKESAPLKRVAKKVKRPTQKA